MKIRLLTAMGGRSESGAYFSHKPNDVVEFTAEEGKRLIESQQGVAADAPEVQEAMAVPKTEKAVTRHRNRSK